MKQSFQHWQINDLLIVPLSTNFTLIPKVKLIAFDDPGQGSRSRKQQTKALFMFSLSREEGFILNEAVTKSYLRSLLTWKF